MERGNRAQEAIIETKPRSYYFTVADFSLDGWYIISVGLKKLALPVHFFGRAGSLSHEFCDGIKPTNRHVCWIQLTSGTTQQPWDYIETAGNIFGAVSGSYLI